MAAHPPPDLKVRPFTRDEYDRMVDLGLFVDEPIELLDGMLVEMTPEGHPHSGVIQELNWHLVRGLPDDVRVRIGHPWAANDISEPEPDIAVVPLGDYFHGGHPGEALLIIEVAHSSLAKDRGIKARIYGSAGVPVYWVIDLEHERILVHTRPAPDGYRQVEPHPFDATLDAAGVPVCLAELLAP